MVRTLIGLFLLANIVGVVANLPRIIDALDGEAIGSTLGEWTVGLGSAVGNLVEEAAGSTLTAEEALAIEERLADDTLASPLDDESVAALVDLWRVLKDAGEQVRAEQLAELLLDEGVDVTDPDVGDPLGSSVP